MERLKNLCLKYNLHYKALSLVLAVALWLMVNRPF